MWGCKFNIVSVFLIILKILEVIHNIFSIRGSDLLSILWQQHANSYSFVFHFYRQWGPSEVAGPVWCEEDATAPPVGAAVPLSCPRHTLFFPDDGRRALHLCSLLSAALRWGTLYRPLLFLLLLDFFLVLFRFSYRCHVPGAEDHFCLGHISLCFPPNPHCAMLPYPVGPLPKYAYLHLGWWSGWSGEGPVWLHSGLVFNTKCTHPSTLVCIHTCLVTLYCVTLFALSQRWHWETEN